MTETSPRTWALLKTGIFATPLVVAGGQTMLVTRPPDLARRLGFTFRCPDRGDGSRDVSNWPVVLLVIIAVMLFRWQGDSWLVTLTKLVGLVALVLVTVAILGVVIAWLS